MGNEAGKARESEWSVLDFAGNVDFMAEDLGSRAKLGDGQHLRWSPAETDVSIRKGWFYHANEQPRSLAELTDIYYQSVGRNTVLLLNVPPDPRGLIADVDARRLGELRDALDRTFAANLANRKPATATNVRAGDARYGADKLLDADPATYWTTDDDVSSASVTVDLGPMTAFDCALLQERIALGQRVEAFTLEAWTAGQWTPVAKGTTIGYERLLRFPEVRTAKVRLTITAARANPAIGSFGLFKTVGVPAASQ